MRCCTGYPELDVFQFFRNRRKIPFPATDSLRLFLNLGIMVCKLKPNCLKPLRLYIEYWCLGTGSFRADGGGSTGVVI